LPAASGAAKNGNDLTQSRRAAERTQSKKEHERARKSKKEQERARKSKKEQERARKSETKES